MKTQQKSEIDQPVSIGKHTKGEPSVKEQNLTVNPGDVIADKPQSVQ
jgi:hypothetical protein